MKKLSLAQELQSNAYPGRGIVIGKTPDGTKAAIAYFIMGRSENSRNRVFVTEGEGIRTQAFDQYVKSGEYEKAPMFTCFEPYFTELEGKTWGIIGLGNIGRKVAQIASVFGCRVIFYSASGNNNTTEYERVDFDTLLAQSDIISLHCPLTDRTQNIMNADAFARMKKTAILINVARGPVVDEQALYEALTTGQIAAAGLDVLNKEPIAADNPLAQIKDSTKLFITPHMAWGSNEARTRCAKEVYLNIKNFLAGEERNVVV